MPWSVPNNLPPSIRGLPAGAQKLWVEAANSVLRNGGTDEDAVKAGWANVKRKYRKAGDKWVKKKYGNVDELPQNVKRLPPIAQRVWMFLFNQQREERKSKKESAEFAWNKIKQKYKWDNENQIWKIKENVVDNQLVIENRKRDKGIFKTWIPFDYEDGKVLVQEKSIGGKKRKYFHGQASNTQIDKENEKVNPLFIRKMKDSALGMNVFAEHQHTIEKTLGFVEEVGGSDDVFEAFTLLEPEGDNELVKTILKKIDNGIKFGYSVGGRVTTVSKKVDDDGRPYVSLDDGELYELSVTPMPAGKDTWVTPLVKSMREVLDEREDWSGEVGDDEEENSVTNTVVLKDQNESDENILKALKEIMESDEIRDQIYKMFWSFQRAIRQVIDGDFKPAEKKAKIEKVSSEFGEEIETLSSRLATLVEKIEEQL
jgi:cation transport regulator ChaB